MLWVPILVTGSSALALAWGWYLQDGAAFARSGAVVTALAVAFIFLQYAKILADREQLIKTEVQETLHAMNVDGKLAHAVSSKIEGLVHSDSVLLDRLITYWQGFVLFIGTIVWGFGDLFVSLRKLSWSEIFCKLIYLGASG
jgi:hypothetical protein